MGAICSTGEDARHRRENLKNRKNPTETYDTWQQKMLLDIGTDPLAVIRDFPRMIVYVGTETHNNYLPAGCAGGAATTPSLRPAENPLTPGISHASSPQTRAVTTHTEISAVSPVQSPLLGTRTTQQPQEEMQQPFAARMRRVREVVLLLSELCSERDSFGAAFDEAWELLTSVGDSDNDSECGTVAAPPAGPPADGRPPPVPLSRRQVRTGGPALDVHQVLLNACVDSGMLTIAEDGMSFAAQPPPSTSSRALTGPSVGGQASMTPIRISPAAGAGRFSRSVSRSGESGPQAPDQATALLSGEPAEGGHHPYGSSSLRRPASGGVSHNNAPFKSSSNSQTRSVASLTGAGGVNSAAAMSRYLVRSATFHLMQFATQGVMFFPVQRLKHVLWMPWSSHMQDLSWTIHFTIKDATAADLIARKQHTLNTLYTTAATAALPTNVAATGAGVGRTGSGSAPAHHHDGNNTNAQTPPAEAAVADKFSALAVTASSPQATTTTSTTAAAAEASRRRKIIVIQHVQAGRHYVEARDRKTTPRYELDWACSIRLDQDTLQETFARYRGFATVGATPSRGGGLQAAVADSHSGARLSPPSVTRRVGRGEEEGSELEEECGGVRSGQQPELLQREVLTSTVEVVAARVEQPPQTLCMISGTWRKRKEELDYVLEQQYHVPLEMVSTFQEKHIY